MPNLSGLSTVTTAATALGNLILVTPNQNIGYQPQNALGTPTTAQQPPTILFHYEGEQTVMAESDITDHFIENNSAIQDQIALKPVIITTHGFIGELNDVTPPALQILKTIADKLLTVEAYTPALTTTALIAYNNALLIYETASTVINSATATWSSITGNGAQVQTKQQTYFNLFYGYWQSRTFFTVQTPWNVFHDMSIKSLRAIQDAETRMITDFEIQFKQIRTAQTAITTSLPTSFQGRSSTQAAGEVNNGTSTPSTSISQSQGLTNMGVQ